MLYVIIMLTFHDPSHWRNHLATDETISKGVRILVDLQNDSHKLFCPSPKIGKFPSLFVCDNDKDDDRRIFAHGSTDLFQNGQFLRITLGNFQPPGSIQGIRGTCQGSLTD